MKDSQQPIYMDYHATTPVDERVLTAMLPYFGEKYGNAASRTHSFGWDGEAAVDRARAQVAKALGCRRREIVFTSGATESINLALKGVACAIPEKRHHFVSLETEHKATLDTLAELEKAGHSVTLLQVDRAGQMDLAQFEAALVPGTLCVSVMHVNNETGVIHPIHEMGEIARKHRVLLHVDAAQGFTKLPIDVNNSSIDLLSVSGHKIYGPKGVGALFVRSHDPKVRLAEQIHGGGHESGQRSGTLNVPGIVGLGAAAELACSLMEEESARVAELRDRLWTKLQNEIPRITLNGSESHRVFGNLNVTFHGVEGESLMLALRNVAVSSGSACTSALVEPSYVLRAMGIEIEDSLASIRFGLGRMTTAEDVDEVARRMVVSVQMLRGL